jgi:hypothetical protein
VEGLYFLPWCLALFSLGARFQTSQSWYGSLVIPLCLLILTAFLFPKGILTPSPKSSTIFVPLFFLFEGLAYACFITGAWFALLYLWDRGIAPPFHTFVLWGFVFYSIAQVAGALWSYLGWATPFHWSSRHLSSASLWCYYAAVLHMKFQPPVKARREAGFALAGVILVLVFMYAGLMREMRMPRIAG